MDTVDTLRADLARVTAERDATRAELMRQIAERDEVRARGRELRREVEALTVERDALRSTLVGERAEIDRLGSVLAHVMAEREALRAAILDLEREDHSVHSEECDGREHVAGDSCGLIVWRDRIRAAGDLARGVRVVEVSRG